MTWFCSVTAPLELTLPSTAPAGLLSASSKKAFVGKLAQAAVAITIMVMIQDTSDKQSTIPGAVHDIRDIGPDWHCQCCNHTDSVIKQLFATPNCLHLSSAAS